MISSYFGALKIGVIAGMRAMTAPALVSHKLSTTPSQMSPDSKLHFLTSPTTATVLKVLAGGELIGDKVPSSPDRISPPQLSGRVASGALSGAALSEADGNPVVWGAILGGLGAIAGSFAFYHLRYFLTHEKGLPDPVVALAEDALAIGLGLWVVNETVPAQG